MGDVTLPQGVTTARSLLVTWANQQSGWVRKIASEVIHTGKPAGAQALDSTYDFFLREKQLKTGEAADMPLLADDQVASQNSVELSLVKLCNLENVNALVQGQVIDFNPKLTVIFGENASGKTGYVRVIKRAAAVRTARPILPDISDTPADAKPPRALFQYRLGGKDQPEVDWHDQPGLAPFNRIDVFDSGAAPLHVDDDLNYIYTPGELSRFPLVQQGIEAVRARLESDTNEKTRTTNRFVGYFDRNSLIYATIESLGASTDLAALKALAIVSEEEQTNLPHLREEIEALRSTDPSAKLKLLDRTKQNLELLHERFDMLLQFDIADYKTKLERLRVAQQKHEAATREAFHGIEIPGVLGEEWRAFVQAGEKYIRAIRPESSYPADGDPCIYCRQNLSPNAHNIIRKYRDYFSDAYSTQLRSADEDLRNCERPLRERMDVPDSSRRTEEVLQNGSEFTPAQQDLIRTALSRAQTLLVTIEARQDVESTDESRVFEQVVPCFGKAFKKVERLRSDLAERSDKRADELRDRQNRLLDIESRDTLRKLLPDIEQFVEQAKWVDKARIQQRTFQGLLRSLTETAKTASDELLNQDFERRFKAECESLRAPKVLLQFPGRHGQVARKKIVSADHRPSEILCEGEQKVIALADFLAEVTQKPVAPVVFDDPITSLDYKRISDVVERIADLAESRQVIVFTHNIMFTMELLAKYEKHPADCSYYEMGRDANHIGVLNKGTHPRTDSFSSLRGRINDTIRTAEKSSGEAKAALVEKGYGLLRTACEVVVETDLLRGVTQRYQPVVRMTLLPSIPGKELETAISQIVPIFSDSCRYIDSHSQPLETLNVRPTVDSLKNDWDTLAKARETYLKAVSALQSLPGPARRKRDRAG